MDNLQNSVNFYFWEKFWLTISLLIIAAVGLIGITDIKKINPFFLAAPGLIICAILMFFQYNSLKKLKVFIAWSILSLIMLSEYFWLKSFHILLPMGNNAVNSLKSPAAFLLLFAIFRKFYQPDNFPELIKRYRGNIDYKIEIGDASIDTIDKNSIIDILSFFLYLIVISWTTIN